MGGVFGGVFGGGGGSGSGTGSVMTPYGRTGPAGLGVGSTVLGFLVTALGLAGALGGRGFGWVSIFALIGGGGGGSSGLFSGAGGVTVMMTGWISASSWAGCPLT